MKYFYIPIHVFLISMTFILNLSLRNSLIYAEQIIDINLDKEIKKGNLLIGLKQYLGNNRITEDSLNFQTDDKFIRVRSINGLIHESKNVKMYLKKNL